MQNFQSLGLAEPLLKAILEDGYTTPTPIQAQAIPHVLAGRDVLGCAQTGTGKTAAFALPAVHRLHTSKPDKARRGPALARILVLSPTRELATQIGESFHAYARHTHLRHTVIFGGVSQFHQVRALRRGVDVIVATPGRLLDLMDQGFIDLSAVEFFVLDEADRMLDMGFIHPIRQIAAELPPVRQTLLFSATMPPAIAKLADSLLKDPVKVAVTPVASAAPKIQQSVHMVDHTGKASLLVHLLNDKAVERALVFTRTKHGADRLTRVLERDGISAESIHGNKSQNQRQRALDAFKYGRSRVLVATDVAARGLDVDGVTHVFNFNLPNEPEAYVHRIGRTGRAGAEGIAVSFCDREEIGYLKAIERLIGQKLSRVNPEMVLNALERQPARAEAPPSSDAAHRHAKRPEAGPHGRPKAPAKAPPQRGPALHGDGPRPGGRVRPMRNKPGQRSGSAPRGRGDRRA